ncbi:MAG TPA: cytochrome c oxidase subunit II [Ignavibacteria bacterium]|nr:cytochrome c oxidase subunit II [Ignavibacteria bacterium]HMR38941.1 cytochrome c oxidase subunit II [Ignavibacteria bacterium]
MRPSIVNEVDFTFWFIMGISIVLLLLITIVMLYFVYKYSRKRNPVATQIEGNTTLEIVWTVIPIILVLIMFFVSWSGFRNMRDVPKDAMIVKVNGQMWKWTFEYDNKKKSDTLFLPEDKNVKFEITSTDVLHSFFLPAFRTKEDAVPGRVNYYWIRTNEPATYYAACAEYCGLNHSYMYAPVIVIETEKFETWKNYFPPDTTKAADSLKTDSAAGTKDTVNSSSGMKDSANTGSDKQTIDTVAKTTPSSDIKKDEIKKTDSLKK